MKFINRTWELSELDKYSKSSQLIVVYGRRRVGKTMLIKHWLETKNGVFSQSIEGSSLLQISQICHDLAPYMETNLRPQNWLQFFELLEKSIKKRTFICLDEFPYLAESDKSLPSILQRWLDQNKESPVGFIISGSSQKMMHSLFLNHSSPLYGRAQRIIKVEPMTYIDFCHACLLNAKDISSFILYSMVGGLPKYWEALKFTHDPIELADILYFNRGALMENEPQRILSDEKVEGITPLSVLEAIGRGSHKPSEISSRLNVKQSSLSKVFAQLTDTSMIQRQHPFGTPEKDNKKTLYKIKDPMLNFWYSVYSSHRSRWDNLSKTEKTKLLHDFASHVFEEELRMRLKGSRYWDNKIEFDCVKNLTKSSISVIEVKFAKLPTKEKEQIAKSLLIKARESRLAAQWEINATQALDWTDYTILNKN